ncbi:inter-alpha-trypsin inhibitor heavy chain H4-like [Saccostrea echinata]|uniref:inter-alpha-trypsin inhibitor heavy chain H4-like n=1 Tax=Saccostrea echinata TaxID=191078 RepID=UPI002A82F127|nr:inter-alpha-trypsin inhibitor heavy chain H4-like [Saccostrea echinata]
MGVIQTTVAFGILLLGFASSQTTKTPEIYYLHVTSEIDFRFAKTVVTSKVVNKEPVASEAVFDLTLPNEAFITAFKLTINGSEIHGKVKEKEKAKQEFEAAKAKGQSAGHIVAKPRETNKFQIQVNVAAQEKVTFELTYRELLRRTKGLYNHVIYINPGRVVDDLKINVLIKESRNITTIKIPPIRSDLLTEDPEGTNELAVVDRINSTKVFISYQPSRAEQESGVSGQFIVQYDVDRSDNAGDILVMDGYFVHFLAPEGIEPMPMDIVFVLDKSGSMSGTKMRQLQESMLKILDDVKAEDRIMIIAFDSSLLYWKPEFVQATAGNITDAKDYIRQTDASGGTNIDLSLREGLRNLIQTTGENGRAPVLVFLTDGEATVGETNTDRILENVKKANEAELPIFSLAFGRGADFNIVKKIAAKNNGFARKIYEDADAALQIAEFYKEISTVLMKNVSFNYVDGTLYDSTVTDTRFNTYFKGSEMVVAGKVKDLNKLQSGMIVNGTGSENQEVVLRVPPMWCTILPWPLPPFPFPTPSPPVTTRNPGMMEKLWAYLTIKQLLKEKEALDSTTEIKKLEDKIVQLSLKYQFVTPLTSMVVTLPDETKANPSEVKPAESELANSVQQGIAMTGRLRFSNFQRARGTGPLALHSPVSNAFDLMAAAPPPLLQGLTGPSLSTFPPMTMMFTTTTTTFVSPKTTTTSTAIPPVTTETSTIPPSATETSTIPPNTTETGTLPPNTTETGTIPPNTTETGTIPPNTRKTSTIPPSTTQTSTFPSFTKKTTTLPPVTIETTTTGPSSTKARIQEKSQVPSFGIAIPGLTKPLCFDLPMASDSIYTLVKLTSPGRDYRISGRFGTEMINNITVNDGKDMTFNANPEDISKTPVYQTSIDGTTVSVRNTPLGFQFISEFNETKTNLEGILSIFKDYSGKLVAMVMESGEFVTYFDLKQTTGHRISLKAITKEFGDGICWYLDNETIKKFYTKISQFLVTIP